MDLLELIHSEPGTFVYIDICNYNELKKKVSYEQLRDSISNLIETGQSIPLLSGLLRDPIGKFIHYIADSELHGNNDTYATLTYSIKNFIELWMEEFDTFGLTMIGVIHYCKEAIPRNFINEVVINSNGSETIELGKNIWGMDVDSFVRQLSQQGRKRLIISEEYKHKVDDTYPDVVKDFIGPNEKSFMGFDEPWRYYYIDLL